MYTAKTILALTITVPLVLLFVVIVLIGVESGRSCAAAVSNAGGTGATGASVAGLNETQLRLARDGVAIGKQRHEPESVIVSELAAQGTESTYRNLANPAVPESLHYANDGLGYDHDSVGPHQMRAGIWRNAGMASLMNPIYQITWFYQQADKYAAQQLSSAELAQAVEQSGPDAYATSMELARRLYAMFANIDVGTMTTDGCGTDGSGAPLSGDNAALGAATVAAAQRWIGTPYVWGGGDATGPTGGGFDCSGLTLYAIYQASGGAIRLPHYTQAQQDSRYGHPVPFSQRAPGDLIFFTTPGERDSHHVAIYLGRSQSGQDLVIHAPTYGETTRVAPLAAVAGSDHMDVRRYNTPPGTGGAPAAPNLVSGDQSEGKRL